MVWFNVDDNLHDHPKARRAGLEAVGLWTVCGSFSAQYLTEGWVPAWKVDAYKGGRKLAAKLVDVGLWIAAEQDGERGYRFHQWDHFNRSKAQVEAEKAANRERQRKRRAGQGHAVNNPVSNSDSHAVTPPVSNADTHGSSHTTLAEPSLAKPIKRKEPMVTSAADPPSSNASQFEAEFDEFWEHYPRKVGKGQARTAFRAARKKVTRRDIATALDAYSQAVAHQSPDKIRHPATWLNGEPWHDDPHAINPPPINTRPRNQVETETWLNEAMERATYLDNLDNQKELEK